MKTEETMMTSVLNDATMQNIKVETSENWEATDCIEHLPPPSTSEQPTFGINTDQCYVPGAIDYNSPYVPKFEFEEIMMNIENDSEMKPELTEDPMCSDVTNNDVFFSTSTKIIYSEEYDKNQVTSARVPKSEVSSKKHSSSGQTTITHKSFRKLSKRQRSCVFCGTTYATLAGLQEHNKFHCSFQKRYTILCKVCGSNWGSPYKVEQHFKTIHNIRDKRKLKSLSAIILADKPVSVKYSNSLENVTNSSFPKLSKKQLRSCVFCGKTYGSLRGFQKHNKFLCSFQKKNKTIVCKLCDSNFRSKYKAIQHIKTIHNVKDEQKLKSLIALISTDEPDSSECKVHNQKHSDSVQWPTRSSSPKLRKNRKSCEFCGKTCLSLTGLQTHIKFHCSLQKGYTVLCKVCGLNLGSPDTAKNHVKNIHNIVEKQKLESLIAVISADEPSSSTCKVSNQKRSPCEQSVTQSTFRKLNKKQRSCVFCGKTYFSLQGLQDHNHFHCSFQKRYSVLCKVCGSKWGSRYKATHHIKMTHNMDNKRNLNSLIDLVPANDAASPKVNSSGEKNKVQATMRKRRILRKVYRCKFCKRELSSYRSWYVHVKHNRCGTRFQFMCKICNWKYTHMLSVSMHLIKKHDLSELTDMLSNYIVKIKVEDIRKATDIVENILHDPFEIISCRFCQKKFPTVDRLKLHSRFYCSFQEKYKFLCSICGLQYHSRPYVSQHIISKHGVERKQNYSLIVLVPPENSLTANVPQSSALNIGLKVSNSSIKADSSTTKNVRNDENLNDSRENRDKVVSQLGSKWDQCEFCKRKFPSPSSLLIHLNHNCPSHKKYKLVCRICNSRLAAIPGLRYHYQQKHGLQNMPWKAEALTFKIESKVPKTHFMRNENGIVPSNSNTNVPPHTISGKRFKCGHCFSSFRKKKYFHIHCRYCKNIGNQNISSHFNKEKEKSENASESR